MNVVAAHIVWTDYQGDDPESFDEWYNREHVRDRVAGMPGFRCGRRFRFEDGAPRNLAFYEAVDSDVFTSDSYLGLIANPDEKSRFFIPDFKNVIRAMGRTVAACGNTNGGTIGICAFDLDGDMSGDAVAADVAQSLERIAGSRMMIRAQLFKTDHDALARMTKNHIRKGDKNPDGFLVIEGGEAAAIKRQITDGEAAQLLAKIGATNPRIGVGSVVIDVRPD